MDLTALDPVSLILSWKPEEGLTTELQKTDLTPASARQALVWTGGQGEEFWPAMGPEVSMPKYKDSTSGAKSELWPSCLYASPVPDIVRPMALVKATLNYSFKGKKWRMRLL